MLTPQEVSEHEFQGASFGGYNMSQVDKFLDTLSADYTSLYNDNAVLKSKLKVLVEKVEEYRATEDAMRKTLMAAQRMADDMIKDAEAKRDEILNSTQTEAKALAAQLMQERENEEYRLLSAQEETAKFLAEMRALEHKHAEYLNALATLCPPKNETVAAMDAAASQIDDSVQRLVSESAPEEPTADAILAEAVQDAADEVDEPTRSIDFGELQFGKDYQIK